MKHRKTKQKNKNLHLPIFKKCRLNNYWDDPNQSFAKSLTSENTNDSTNHFSNNALLLRGEYGVTLSDSRT